MVWLSQIFCFNKDVICKCLSKGNKREPEKKRIKKRTRLRGGVGRKLKSGPISSSSSCQFVLLPSSLKIPPICRVQGVAGGRTRLAYQICTSISSLRWWQRTDSKTRHLIKQKQAEQEGRSWRERKEQRKQERRNQMRMIMMKAKQIQPMWMKKI